MSISKLHIAIIAVTCQMYYCTLCNIGLNVSGGVYTQNLYMDSYVIRAHDRTGPKMCIKDCLLQSECNAVNFRKKDWACELLKVSYPADQSSASLDFSYTPIDSWTMVRLLFYVVAVSAKNID